MTEPAPRTIHADDREIILFDDYELDIPCFELRREGAAVPLEPQVFEVLAYLVRNADRVVSKDELLDSVWPERYVTDGALNSRVMAARKAIGDSGKEQRYIKTIHGRGYRFVGHVGATSDAPGSVRPAGPIPSSDPIPFPVETQPSAALSALAATLFVGREEELQRIRDLLAQPGCRLVSLLGPGGVGKTRLAVEAANRAAAAGHSVTFVPLEAIADPREVPAVMAASLGLALRSEDPVAELLTYLAPRRELLLLDNFEQLLDAGTFLRDILDRAPGITLLVTSRSVLGLPEEWSLRIAGLPLAGEPTESDAVRLFLDRAARANAWLAPPSSDELEEVDEICRLVDGMPLALELAASLTRYLPFGEIAAHIRNDISILSSTLRSAPDRHRSVVVLMEESCRHLAKGELTALEALAVFEGPFTADAAAKVAQAPLPLLRNLVDHSLLQTRQGTFSLHPLMRQFALERLTDRLPAVRDHHAEYYSRLASSLVPALEGGGQVPASQRVEEDYLNFAAAWRWACEQRRLDLLDPMAYPFFLALTFRGRYFDSHELLQRGVAVVREKGDAGRELLAALLTSRAWIIMRFGRGADAARDAQEALAIQAQDGLRPRPGIGADPRLALAILYHGAGDYAKAYESAIAVLEDALVTGESTAIAFASWMGGSARLRQARLVCERQANGTVVYATIDRDDPDDAVEAASRLLRAARAVLREMGDSWLSAYVEIELGLIAGASGDREQSCEHYRRAYELRSAFNDPQGMASSQVYLAGALVELGRIDEAENLHRDILCLASSIGDSYCLADAQRSMSAAAVARGDWLEAMRRARLAAQQSIAINFTNNLAGILLGVGRIFMAVGEAEQAAHGFATISSNPASTPFSRAASEMWLNVLSGVLPPSKLAGIRRAAGQVQLVEATRDGIAVLERMQDRLAAASASSSAPSPA
ncbi:MAG TPA: winged helix-turn-helix domain-containing protein [Tepidiformaceae bacterium]|nr:winged helix-turn-helix domain-containing protein [Tepidiformaceae bacterium]